MTRRALLVLAVCTTIAAVSSTSEAASKRKTDFPCPGCVTELPDPIDAQTKAPLIVVLHGDGQGPTAVAHLFAKEASARGMVLFVPKCPKADGCADAKWWSWNHDPSWFDAPLAAIDAVQPLDHDRFWLVGWSGGGSYIGRVAPALAGRFAAVNVDGGGMMPDAPSCPTKCALPAYFLVGDKNYYHSLAVDLQGWFSGCKQEVVWELLPGKGHDGEWDAISKPARVATIVDWFEKHPRACLAAATSTSASVATESPSAPPAAVSSDAPAMIDAATGDEPAATPAPIKPGPCGCGVTRESSSTAALASLASIAIAMARRIKATRRA